MKGGCIRRLSKIVDNRHTFCYSLRAGSLVVSSGFASEENGERKSESARKLLIF